MSTPRASNIVRARLCKAIGRRRAIFCNIAAANEGGEVAGWHAPNPVKVSLENRPSPDDITAESVADNSDSSSDDVTFEGASVGLRAVLPQSLCMFCGKKLTSLDTRRYRLLYSLVTKEIIDKAEDLAEPTSSMTWNHTYAYVTAAPALIVCTTLEEHGTSTRHTSTAQPGAAASGTMAFSTLSYSSASTLSITT